MQIPTEVITRYLISLKIAKIKMSKNTIFLMVIYFCSALVDAMSAIRKESVQNGVNNFICEEYQSDMVPLTNIKKHDLLDVKLNSNFQCNW